MDLWGPVGQPVGLSDVREHFLIGSCFADLVLRGEAAVLLGIATIVLAAKELLLRRLTTKRLLNGTALLLVVTRGWSREGGARDRTGKE